MSILQGRYSSPGVYTEVIPGPIIGANPGAPSLLGLVGTSVGSRAFSESVLVPSDGPSRALSNEGVHSDTVVVSDPTSGRVFEKDVDYEVNVVDSSLGEEHKKYTISALSEGELSVDRELLVSYRFTDSSYYNPNYFYDPDDLEDFYGRAFDEDENIASELSLAGRIAFLNGASGIICVPVKPEGSSVTPADYTPALNKLTSHPVSVLAVTTGDKRVHTFVNSHVENASRQGAERRAILGIDGSQTTSNTEDRQAAAQALNSKRIALITPDRVSIASTINPGVDVRVGGQYLAIAVAAMSTAFSPATPLTRKFLSGFTELGFGQSNIEKDIEAQSGLMVVEQTQSGGLRVRHGITTNPSQLLTREWTITGQEDALAKGIRDSLDGDGLIGGIIDDLTLANVKASVDAALETLVQGSSINGYQNLKVRQLPSQPDVVEVRFEWRPSVPLNYIAVRYSISITTGETTAETE